MFCNIFLVFNYLVNISLSTIQIYNIIIFYTSILLFILYNIYMFNSMFLVYVCYLNIQHVTLYVNPTHSRNMHFAYMPTLKYLCAYYINKQTTRIIWNQI